MYNPITDEQWALLEPLFVEPAKRGRGKPHLSWRLVLNSIFFVLFTGSKWAMLPKTPEFASKSASHRWYLIWDKNGFLQQILEAMKGFNHNIGAAMKFPPKRQRRPRVAPHSTAYSLPSHLHLQQVATA